MAQRHPLVPPTSGVGSAVAVGVLPDATFWRLLHIDDTFGRVLPVPRASLVDLSRLACTFTTLVRLQRVMRSFDRMRECDQTWPRNKLVRTPWMR